MSLVIRDATAEDLPQILKIYSYYVENTNFSFEYETPSLAVFQRRYEGITASFPWLVAVWNDTILGYAYGSRAFERAAYQWDADVTVYLAPSHRKKGFAKPLYECLIAILQLQGYYNLYALITDANEASRKFHGRMGFSEVGHLRNSGFKKGTWLGVVWMEKILRETRGTPESVIGYKNLPSERVMSVITSVTSRFDNDKRCGIDTDSGRESCTR